MARAGSGKANKGNGADPGGPLAGLKFAVYARKSTEDARHEDHTSTARQIDQATRYVETRGGVVLPECQYTDEATSGAEFRGRLGLLKFLEALRNGKPFSALVMMDESRLGREQIETQYTLKQITDAGVRVFYYQTGEEAKLDTSLDKIMSALKMFGAEQEREKARLRCREAAERKARQGHVPGGRCYGYENVRMKGDRPASPEETPDYVTRRIVEAEAEVIRGIFRAYAEGIGMVRIAKALNGDPQQADATRRYFGGRQIPPPRGRASGWAPTLIREMLHRPLYRGEVVWGRRMRTDRDGRAGISVKRDAQDWLRQDAPALRIIEEPLWREVQDQLKAQAGIFLRDHRGKLWGKPDGRREGRYLLSGLATCAQCGGRISVLGGAPRVYGCPAAGWKGVCGNRLTKRVEPTDAAFLGALAREVLTPERFRYAVQVGVARVREALAKEPNRTEALDRERAGLQRKIARLVAAIGDGKGPAALVKEIEKAEARVTEIEAELARLQAGPALVELDLKRIERDVAGHLERFGDLLRGNVLLAKQALKKLLVSPVTLTPTTLDTGRRTYAFRADLSYGAVLREVICSPNRR